MSDQNNRIIQQAIVHRDDIMFNLMSLKYNLLVEKQKCDKCDIKTLKWNLISLCHHTICQNCIYVSVHSKDTCLKCKIKFNPKIHSISSQELRREYSVIEQVVWNMMAIENGTHECTQMDEQIEVLKSNKSSKTAGPNLSIETFQEKHNSELPYDINNDFSQSSSDIQKIQLSKNANFEDKEHSKDSPLVHLNSTQIEGLSENLGKINNLDVNTNYSNVNISCKSDDGIIEGTPEKCHDLNHVSSTSSGIIEPSNKKIVLAYSDCESEDFKVLNKFKDFFDIEECSSWNDSVTHLVMKTANGNKCSRTKKYFNALLSHCCIVSFDWIIDCLSTKSLLPEINYMAIDSSSEQPAALISWKVGQGIIKSPMEWTKHCILFFHSSVKESNNLCSDVIDLAKKAGFVLADSVKEFNEQYKMRFIIFDPPIVDDLSENITSWMFQHNALSLNVQWIIECLCQFRFVPISSEHVYGPLNTKMIKSSGLHSSYFSF